MLLIECPWCGPRAESEFSCGGEADIARPLDTEKLTDKEWGDYLFMRKNPRGVHREQWMHAVTHIHPFASQLLDRIRNGSHFHVAIFREERGVIESRRGRVALGANQSRSTDKSRENQDG